MFADKIESFPTGVMVCEVEVDPETGAITLDRLTAVADCGVVVNPRLLAGQIHGGIAHGVGNALMEEAKYDEETGPAPDRHLDGLRPAARRRPARASTSRPSPRPRPTTSWA